MTPLEFAESHFEKVLEVAEKLDDNYAWAQWILIHKQFVINCLAEGYAHGSESKIQ
jgi:hypothetical protein